MEKEGEVEMNDPCKDCVERKLYARLFDSHFWGDDCPYVCEEYERYKADKPKDEGGEVGMNVQIHECHRKNLCVDCDDKKCWHSGELIADCPLWKCNREGKLFEDCESCELLKQIHAEGR